jgi:hypothetical protein
LILITSSRRKKKLSSFDLDGNEDGFSKNFIKSLCKLR